ncbi:Alpha-1,2-mannosidase [Mucinivorans hirudinis]|uniref:Alpha-1,2-mannosidase n=1 Tax=Mucinivorans hirudinis TaxID=1433126 RepID=A0A060RCZ6_9BACT|nr:Alpha-1,2-mannosidase [Mucinivorans hirudinis]
MKKNLLSALIFLVLTTTANGQGNSRFVNPFIGTSNFGTTQPGAVVPQGMVSMSPFNTIPHAEHKVHTDGWCSTPYTWDNKWTIGFTQVNLSGVGCPDYGSLLLMPTVGSLEVDFQKYAVPITNQTAQAGYYSCNLADVHCEMTATKRTTLSRYTFTQGQSNILFNIGQGLTTESGCYAKIVSNSEIEGFKIMGDFCYGEPQSVIPIYFVVRTSKPSLKVRYWKKAKVQPGAVKDWSAYSGTYKVYEKFDRPIAGDDIGVAFTFNTSENEKIEVAVGVSFVSIENARENLKAETAPFEKIYADAVASWDKVLSVVDLQGGTEDQKVQFYTALYHNWIHPNVLSDTNGEYPAMGSGRTIKGTGEKLTMFSGWDVYRISPFFSSFFYPARQNAMVKSMMEMYRQNGSLPRFEIGGQEFNVMEGDAALPYLTGCYLLGMTKGVDTEELYQAMLKNALGETYVRGRQDFYDNNYYIPLKKEYDNSVSQALEYYIADWSLAQFALKIGRKDDHEMLMRRAMGYKKYFDPAYALLRPVLENGEFMPDFNPLEGENFAPANGFHEGTSWNYSFAIPYDIKGLIKEFGSERRFVDSLNVCFEKGYFDMGNEPDMGYPFIFNYVKGNEWRTQYWVNECLTKEFGNKPGGLPGNDDAGTMSAWQNFAMMGIYPPCPSKPEYTFSTPVFDKVTINLDPTYYTNKTLTIEAINRSKKNIYIEKIEVGGKRYNSFFISASDLMNAGVVKIYCTDKPRR